MLAPKITDIEVGNKKVILRADLDVDKPTQDDARLKAVADTIKYLISKDAKVIVMGHRGRPEGKVNNEFSLKPVCDVLSKIIEKDIKFIYDIAGAEAKEESNKLQNGGVLCLENLRFDTREEANDEQFAKSLAELGEVYINESFASSHRAHASIVGLPSKCKSESKSVAMGFRFEKEIENLSKVFEGPRRPLMFIISGLKKDKLDYVKSFEESADKILIGGRLPELMGDKALESVRLQTGNVIVGNLNMDKEDITLNTVDVFCKEIKDAGTIVVSGPLGKFEDEGHRQGTEKVMSAVVMSSAFKVAGGGDTEDAIRLLNLQDKFDWISVGGGAMLEFLSTHILPGIEALK